MSLEPLVRFPIVCPRCMRETLFHIPAITEALVTRNDISLSTACCHALTHSLTHSRKTHARFLRSYCRAPATPVRSFG